MQILSRLEWFQPTNLGSGFGCIHLRGRRFFWERFEQKFVNEGSHAVVEIYLAWSEPLSVI